MPEIHPLEFGEQLLLVLRPDTDTGVLDRYGQHDGTVSLRCFRLPPNCQRDAAALRVFHRIGKQIRDDLPEPHLVAVQRIGDGGVHVQNKIQPLISGPEVYHVADVVEQRAELIRPLRDLQPSGFDLGEVQNIVDNGQ